jgi:hypothetical protein
MYMWIGGLAHLRGVPTQGNVDGAYFGTTFPHLLLMSYPHIRPAPADEAYVPRIFGFKLHSSTRAVPEADAPATNGPATTTTAQRSSQGKRKDEGEDGHHNGKNAIQRMSPG